MALYPARVLADLDRQARRKGFPVDDVNDLRRRAWIGYRHEAAYIIIQLLKLLPRLSFARAQLRTEAFGLIGCPETVV